MTTPQMDWLDDQRRKRAVSGDDIGIVRRMCEGGNGVFHDACLAVCDEVERLRKRLQACQSNDDYPLTDDCITQNERFLLAEVERLRAEYADLLEVYNTVWKKLEARRG